MSVSRRPQSVRCPNCGQIMNEDDLYCRFCGQPMVATAFGGEGHGKGRTAADDDDPPIYDPGDFKPLAEPRSMRASRRPAFEGFRGGLGCGGFTAIGAIALAGIVLILWFVARPSIDQAAQNGVSDGLARRLAVAAPAQPGAPIVLTQGAINDILVADSPFYDPIASPRITIDDNQVRVTFSIYGLSGEYQGGLTVQEGRIRIIDPRIVGSASLLVDSTRVTAAIEGELLAYTTRTGVGFAGVTVDGGVITITPIQ